MERTKSLTCIAACFSIAVAHALKWVRGGVRTETGYRHTYQAKAVFNLYGVERESEPTAEVQMTSVYVGTMLSVK